MAGCPRGFSLLLQRCCMVMKTVLCCTKCVWHMCTLAAYPSTDLEVGTIISRSSKKVTQRRQGRKGRAGIGTQAWPPAVVPLCYFICPISPRTFRSMWPLLLTLLWNRLANERRRHSLSVGECFAGASHWGWGGSSPDRGKASLSWGSSSEHCAPESQQAGMPRDSLAWRARDLLSISGKC